MNPMVNSDGQRDETQKKTTSPTCRARREYELIDRNMTLQNTCKRPLLFITGGTEMLENLESITVLRTERKRLIRTHVLVTSVVPSQYWPDISLRVMVIEWLVGPTPGIAKVYL